MAVVAMWKCDRDGAMFDNKKDAEEHDKMLELAANITALIELHVAGVPEEASEAIGMLLAERRDLLAKALKGKPEILLQQDEESSSEPQGSATTDAEDKVTPLAAAG